VTLILAESSGFSVSRKCRVPGGNLNPNPYALRAKLLTLRSPRAFRYRASAVFGWKAGCVAVWPPLGRMLPRCVPRRHCLLTAPRAARAPAKEAEGWWRRYICAQSERETEIARTHMYREIGRQGAHLHTLKVFCLSCHKFSKVSILAHLPYNVLIQQLPRTPELLP